MKKYECSVCGYIYDSKIGDADAMIPVGTEFEELPEDWTCPVCRAGKKHFIEAETNNNSACDIGDVAPQNPLGIDGTLYNQ